MRDYGVVRVRFWDWAKRKGLDLGARELALYLLTSPHGNSLGCFRLPAAYLSDDLGKGIETVSETLSKLFPTGFVERDEPSGWTWIRGYLDHNPIPNRNVGKSVEKMIDAVPAEVSFYGRMIDALRQHARTDDKGLSVDFLDKMAERYRNRSDTVSRESKTHTQTHTHDHDPTHEHDQEHTHDPAGAKVGAEPGDLPMNLPSVAKVKPDDVVRLWNDTAQRVNDELGRNEWPTVRDLSPKRRKTTIAAIKAHGIHKIRSAIERASLDPWARNQTKRKPGYENWRFHFDHLIAEDVINKFAEMPSDDGRRGHVNGEGQLEQFAKGAASAAGKPLKGIFDEQ